MQDSHFCVCLAQHTICQQSDFLLVEHSSGGGRFAGTLPGICWGLVPSSINIAKHLYIYAWQNKLELAVSWETTLWQTPWQLKDCRVADPMAALLCTLSKFNYRCIIQTAESDQPQASLDELAAWLAVIQVERVMIVWRTTILNNACF